MFLVVSFGEAFKLLGGNVVVQDSGFVIEALNGSLEHLRGAVRSRCSEGFFHVRRCLMRNMFFIFFSGEG